MTQAEDPIVVAQMGKVSSKSVSNALEGLGGSVYHVHHLCRDRLRTIAETYETAGKVPPHIARSYEVLEKIVDRGKPARVISMVRDPIARNISAFFQNKNVFAAGEADVSELIRRFIETYPHEVPIEYFDVHIKPVFGIDVFETAFDREQRSLLATNENFSLLVLRTEDSDDSKQASLARFLNRTDISLERRNVGSDKSYASEYAEFLERIRLPQAYVDRMLGSRMARHFYTAEELAGFRARWERSGAANTDDKDPARQKTAVRTPQRAGKSRETPMARIAFFPVVETAAQLTDLLSRAAWFCTCSPIERITIFVGDEHLTRCKWSVAPGMDPAIQTLFPKLEALVHFVVPREESDLEPEICAADFVLEWSVERPTGLVSAATRAEWFEGKKVLSVDPVAIRMEGSFYIDVSSRLLPEKRTVKEECAEKFRLLAQKLGRFSRAYLMATGPSVGGYEAFDYDGSLTIVCNSVILNEDLMDRVRPKILVFADPIFHFGPSQYAATFREQLRESARKHDFSICIPFKYYALFTARVPELADRTIGIPFVKDRPFNFDLAEDFTLKTTANILTFVMVPLATTFADEVGIIGCDGRPLSDDDYFWSHNPATQFNDKMANIREVHPGFFDLDYNDYYLEHCDLLEAQLTAGEEQGKLFINLGFSHIPALRKRFGRGRRLFSSVSTASPTNVLLASWCEQDKYRAGGARSRQLASAFAADGCLVEVLDYPDSGGDGIAGHVPESESLENGSVSAITGVSGDTEVVASGEVLAPVLPLIEDNDSSLLFLDVDAISGLRAAAALTRREAGLFVHIRLRNLPPAELESADLRDEWQRYLEWVDLPGPRVTMSVTTPELQGEVADRFRLIVDVVPDVSSAAVDEASYALAPLRGKQVFPRLLVIDLTPVGGLSATGRVKEALFRGWPVTCFLLAHYHGPGKNMRLSEPGGAVSPDVSDTATLVEKIRAFAPDVIYYRAVDNKTVHSFAVDVVAQLELPYVIHIMDDWPERLSARRSREFAYFDETLRDLLAGASARLAIGQAMSDVFAERYQLPFTVFANAVDGASFPPRPMPGPSRQVFNIRYTGALADDMTMASVIDVAQAIRSLPPQLGVRLQIYTRNPWLQTARQIFAEYDCVELFEQVTAEDYYGLLQGADALLIAYNFDEASVSYIGLSMANKMPEYLASGAPIIAYGPAEVATIDYLGKASAALVIRDRNQVEIAREIGDLVKSPESQAQLSSTARCLAFGAHDTWQTADALRQLLNSAAGERAVSPLPATPLIGPHDRDTKAHWDETKLVACLFEQELRGGLMIDVGAHQGTALAPFLNAAWSIYAFEPDDQNRARLEARLRKHEHGGRVTLDTRCVGSESCSDVPFFTSEQSTGISGLSAFHESHSEAQRVDITTLTEFAAAHTIDTVDFLKIDTEGHDLFVLKGFPWDRIKPQVVECEFEDGKTEPLGYRFHDLASYLREKGYTVYVSEWHPIVRYGVRHQWRQLCRYPCELADPEGWGNLIAFREEPDESALCKAALSVIETERDLDEQSEQHPAFSAAVATDFMRANALFRAGAIAEAVHAYRALYHANPLDVYALNALCALKKQGSKDVASIDDVKRLWS